MVDQYYSETDTGFVPCQYCKPMVDELLAACKAAEEVIEDRMDNSADLAAFEAWSERCDKVAAALRAAIAKAEGTK